MTLAFLNIVNTVNTANLIICLVGMLLLIVRIYFVASRVFYYSAQFLPAFSIAKLG